MCIRDSQYSDLANDGPYGYGPDVWYQANDIIMQYAENQHILPLPIDSLGYADQIPESAWNAYALNVDGTTYYCGVPINVQTGMLYYIESMLPDNWETDWDVNGNGTPDFFETYTALYAFSKETQEGGGKTEYGYLDELVDTYFMTGYLFTFGGYIFGDNNTNPEDIGLAAGNAAQGAWMIRQWAELMNNTEIVAKDFASSAYSYQMLCTVKMCIRDSPRRAPTGQWSCRLRASRRTDSPRRAARSRRCPCSRLRRSTRAPRGLRRGHSRCR